MEQLEKEAAKNSNILEAYIEEGYKTLSESVNAYNFEDSLYTKNSGKNFWQ